MTKELNKIQRRSDAQRAEGDAFFTPAALARDLIAITPIVTDYPVSILDPAKGLGAFYNNYPVDIARKSYCEISEGSDFYDLEEKSDWLITNPPFSNFKKWLIHSCKLAKVGFAYIVPAHGLTEHRIRACADLGFNITSLTFFKAPEEWNLGFSMIWVVWEKKPVEAVKVLDHPTTCQETLVRWIKEPEPRT